MTREEHLAWCKKRALEYVERGKYSDAYASMVSDLGKHPGTAGHLAIQLGMSLMMAGHLDDKDKMTKFIEDFG